MKMHKEEIKKEDGRYLIYYSFDDEDFARKDCSVKGGNESGESGKSSISKGGGADV
ncbi:MAG TPA: hypothetical protein VKY40_01070 [Halanaerobiales bacterium]|nr:hypothetical protein [Halanaerobiales bacterium]